MLTKFSVSNFKRFNAKLIFDLEDTKGYLFNGECVKNGIVNSALVYGPNGVGKSNLSLAIFDIIGHLTDKQSNDSKCQFYLNAFNDTKEASFEYEFCINSHKVRYVYLKTDHRTVVFEQFFIDGELLAQIDRRVSEETKINFKGTESLKTHLSNPNLSLLKYIKNNSVLEMNEQNRFFLGFFDFIEGMLFVRSLKDNIYLGLENGSKDIAADIIEKGNVADLEMFLNKAGVECKLTVVKESEVETIAFDFDGHATAADDSAIATLLNFFKEEASMGKLYISYPMVEALKHIPVNADFKENSVIYSA